MENNKENYHNSIGDTLKKIIGKPSEKTYTQTEKPPFKILGMNPFLFGGIIVTIIIGGIVAYKWSKKTI